MKLGRAEIFGRAGIRARQSDRRGTTSSALLGLLESLIPAIVLLLLIEAGLFPGIAHSEPGDIIIERQVPPRVAERKDVAPSPEVVSVNPSPNRLIQGVLNGNSPSAPVQHELGDGEIAAIVTGAVGGNRPGAGHGGSLVGTAGNLGGTGIGGPVNGAVLPATGGGSPVGNVGGMVNSAVGDALRGAGLMK